MLTHSPDCPYCSLALKAGELYCSKHGADMSALKSGVFYIAGKQFEECDWHVTRLSLNFNLDTTQPYFIGDREYRVSPQKYLLINEGQSFKTVNQEARARMVTLAYQVGLPARMFNALSKSHQQLLDDADTTYDVGFFEQTFPTDEFLMKSVHALCDNASRDLGEDLLEDRLENILVHILMHQHDLRGKVMSIDKAKSSTRFEIYRRLQWAVEFGYNHFHEPIAVETLATQGCLSLFHFKRLFKEVYGLAPYQFIRNLRMEKAKALLQTGMPVNQVCKSVGWEDSSSFIRLFKKEFAMTPVQFQQISQCANRAYMI
jgi:AraC-like DNA-binding protein